MTLVIFLAALIGGMLIGLPICFALLFSGVCMMLYLNGFNAQILSQNLFSGADSFSMMAVPFFIMAGEFMNRGSNPWILRRTSGMPRIQFNHRFCNGNQDESIYYRVYRIKRTCRYPRKWNISYCNVLRASFRWTSCKRSKCRSTSQTCTCMCNRYEYSSKCRRNGCTASLDEAFTCRELLVCIRYICSCSYGRFNRSSNCSNDSLLILNDLLFARQSCYYKAWRFFYTTDIFLYILL